MDINSQIEEMKKGIDYYKFYTQFDEIADTIRAGSKGDYWAVCPLHMDTNPSFQIKPDGRFFCWSEHKGGDVIDFWQRYYNVSSGKAIIGVAKWAGYKLEFSKESKEELEKKKQLVNFNLDLLEHFEENLKRSNKAQSYLESRGLLEVTIKNFRIGYYDPYTIFKFIPEENYDIAVKSGVLKLDNNGKVQPFSKVPRIIFPYLENGFPKTFTSRALNNDITPKYLNFSNNEFAKKEDLIYGIDTARDTILKYKSVYIAEGQIDIMKAWQKGVKNVIGVSGIKMTQSQIFQLRRYTKNFILCIEDSASFKHIRSSNEEIAKNIPFARVKILKLYDEEKCDLDNFLTKYTKNDLLTKTQKALPYNEFVVEEALSRVKIRNVEDKIRFINLIKAHLLSVKSGGERKCYIKRISEAIDYPEEQIEKDLRNKEIKMQQENYAQETIKHEDYTITTQNFLIALLFYDIDVFKVISKYKEYNIEQYFENNYKEIYQRIIFLLDEGKNITDVQSSLENDATYKNDYFTIIPNIEKIIIEEDELDEYLKEVKENMEERKNDKIKHGTIEKQCI